MEELSAIEEMEQELEELQKGLTLATSAKTLVESDEFKTVFIDNFVTAYRETAVVNIGVVRADAIEGIKVGLIGRAQFENYCLAMVGAVEPLEAQVAELKLEMAEENKKV